MPPEAVFRISFWCPLAWGRKKNNLGEWGGGGDSSPPGPCATSPEHAHMPGGGGRAALHIAHVSRPPPLAKVHAGHRQAAVAILRSGGSQDTATALDTRIAWTAHAS